MCDWRLRLAAGFVALMMVAGAVGILRECGVRGFLFGTGAFYAAVTGACDR